MADTAEEFLLGKRLMYRGEELLLHRKYKGQHDETLVKWSRLPKTDKHEDGQEKESETSKEFLIWMREEEIAACCPQLRPGASSRPGRKTDGQALAEEEEKGKLHGEETDQPDDSLEEMAQDVRMLVERAQRITHRISSNSSAPGIERRLANTINILSAYAKLGSLADSFRQCGALDLLLNLLSFQLPEVRQSAGEMLRSLSAYDSASRAYVLLQLTHREGEEENGAASLENRQMLLDLFAETASQEEDSLSCSNLGLAKVPGRFIYSLLKKYLRVTSSANLFGWNERSSSSSSPSPPPALKVTSHRLRPSIKEDFKHFECLFLLMSELFTMFEWTDSRLQEEREKIDTSPGHSGLSSLSIFTGTMPASGPMTLSKEMKKVYRTRNDFTTDREYGEYVKSTVQAGSRVRARVSYESVSVGDTGKYLGTNDGTPPAQCLWDGLSGASYWVHWHQIELLGKEEEDVMADLDQASMVAQSQSARRPYALTTAVPEVREVTRHQWWEVLCLVKRELNTHLPEVLSVLPQPKLKRFDDLLPLTPSCSQVAEVIVKLEAASPQLKREPLSVREEREFQVTYQRLMPVIKDEGLLQPTDSVTSCDAMKKTPPFPDPYDKDDLPLPLPSRLSPSHSLMMLMSGIVTPRLDGPLAPLEAAENSWEDSDFSLSKLMEHKSTIEKLLAKYPLSCRVAVCSLRVLLAAVNKISKDIDRIDCCVSCSMFSLILQLMQRERTSHTLQALGLKCFFALMGGAAIDGSLPISPSKIRPEPLSEDTRLTVLTVVMSLSSVPGHGGLKSIMDGLESVTNSYNMSMTPSTRECITNAVLDGLSILVALMNMNESLLVKQLEGWNLPDLFATMPKCLPDCPTRELLCRHIAAGLQGETSAQLMADKVKKDGEEVQEESMEDQILECVRMLKRGSVWLRTPLPLLLKLAGLQLPVEGNTMVRPPPLFTQTFLLHHGVHHLTRNIERNSSVSVNENTVRLLGCLIMAGEEEAEEVILQGGLRSIASAMSSYSSKDIHKLACEVLLMLSKYPDLLIVMAAEKVNLLLTSSKEKFSYDLNLCSLIDQLMSKLKGEVLATKVAQSNKIMAIIFGGVLQLLMAEIEDTRRSQRLPCIPLLSSFVSFISFAGGTSGVITSGKKEVCYEKIEVSSNTYKKNRLTDGTMDTYWESSGRSGTHWVRITMKKGAIIKRLAIDINPDDSSYMPQRIVVQGGPTPEDLTDINTLTVPSMYRGSFELVSNLTRHYDVVVLRIKRCQQGGIDVRLRGLTCQGGQSSLWPIFGDLLLARSKLFYFIQGRTWTIDTSLDPLDLFDRLRSVISYEQSFADSYILPTPARHALGQACRAALFNPLITALSSKDRKGTCLSDLLSQYLAHTKSSSQPSCFNSDDIILMSSTRRMCRLLVDCDGSVAMSTERGSDQTLAVANLASGSSIVTLATCWQEVVTKEVKLCLEMCDLSCVSPILPKPHDIVSAIVRVYDRLQHATMELFGGHSWFMVAVKEGFTSVFQSLDETAGVRLCEVLCECVNSIMMAEVSSEQLLLREQEEGGNEALLLSQVTELLQFMNRLDLASVFECFYRNHLSQRLLSHFSNFSLSRERQLVQSLAHCFPNKHPQHMLADIEQSRNLMNQFCQLDLLESLDQLLDKQGVKSKNLPPNALELSRKIWFYRQRSLEVSVLTPWCWTLHHSPLPPVSSLPSPLNGFVEDYTKFYRSAHKGSHHHERTRQLQWTLYGTAVVTCGSMRLMVSTAQMIILMQFNSAERLTYSQLMDTTLLPTNELSEALHLLTSEPHPVLCSAHSHKHTLTSDTPLLPNTAFQVNEHFVSQLHVGSGQLVTCCHGNDSRRGWKANASSYSTHLFEQRRAIIDSAVARTMKRERTLSVDSVAGKVIKGCSVGQFLNGSTFGRFNCSFKDVCASVERLRASGYITRNPDHPHILVYVPDPGEEEPSVEHGYTNSSVVEEPAVSTISPLLLPSTMLPSAGVMPPLPPSSPLGLPRKRSGSNTSPHTNPKRKQQPLGRNSNCTQSFTTVHEENEEKDRLLHITTSSVTSSLSLQQVQDQVALLTAQVAAVVNMKEDKIECLLVLCAWNKDLLLQRYFTDKDSLLIEAGLAPPISHHPQSPQLQCPVCLQDQCKEDMKALWCGHNCCTSCWTSYLQTQVVSFTRSLRCTCPTTDCLARPTRTFFTSLFEPDSHVMEHFNKALVRSYIDSSSTLTWCRNPLGCDRVLWQQGNNMDCNPCSKCGWSSCFSCTYVESHEPASCSNIHKWVEEGGFHEGMNEDSRSKHLANIISKRCPSCSTQIEKNEGCLNVKCKCGYDFCWRCMKPWRPTHTDYFNCTAKVSKAAKDAKKLVDYNQRCASHHKSKLFAQKLCVLVKGIGEPTPSKTLAFLSDACELLTSGHKMLCYSCVAEFYSSPDSHDYLCVLTSHLDTCVTALQIFLENTLLGSASPGHAVRMLSDRRIQDGYQLLNMIKITREKIIVGSYQQYKLGDSPSLSHSSGALTTGGSDVTQEPRKKLLNGVSLTQEEDEEEEEEEDDDDEEGNDWDDDDDDDDDDLYDSSEHDYDDYYGHEFDSDYGFDNPFF